MHPITLSCFGLKAQCWLYLATSCIGEGNGNPLQCSCLESPRDGEPGGLPSMGSHRVGHDWSELAAAAAATVNTQCLAPLTHWELQKGIILVYIFVFDWNAFIESHLSTTIRLPSMQFTGEGNGNPLQYSCLENPRDRGGWQATVHRIAELDRTETT